MKIIEIKCPSCRAPIETNLEKTRKYSCRYCRSTLYLRNEEEKVPVDLERDCIYVNLREILDEAGLDLDDISGEFNYTAQLSPSFTKIFKLFFIVIFVVAIIMIFLVMYRMFRFF